MCVVSVSINHVLDSSCCTSAFLHPFLRGQSALVHWFFTKRRVPSDIYDCETPLFAEPPDDLAIQYHYKHAPGGQRFALTVTEVKRHSFALCFVYALLNEAASFYKQNSCPADRINLEKSRNLVQVYFTKRQIDSQIVLY